MEDNLKPGLGTGNSRKTGNDAVLKKKILVIDDEYHIRKIIRLNLEMDDFDVMTAGDGKEALEMISREKPDLVIADILMPEINGLEFFLTLKEKESTSDIPVIIITGKVEYEDIKFARLMGVDDYITKPFNPKDLTERIKELLDI
ncbi:MAG: response regulator [Candidatus Eremiobacteraeota bacterium]|nr:response regulator [Candidatus Eremiobacteraeota bacterium]